MADDVVQKKPEEDGVMSVLGRVGEGVIDGLAKAKPIIGVPLQALANTDEYQARQAQRDLAKQKLAEWNAEAGLREKKRKLEEDRTDFAQANLPEEQKLALAVLRQKQQAIEEWNAGAPTRAAQNEADRMRAKEYVDSAGDRNADRAASLARSQLVQAQADKAFEDIGVSQQAKTVNDMLGNHPIYRNLSLPERAAVLSSPAFQAVMRGKFYSDQLVAASGGDKAAQAFLGRAIRNNGWALVDGKDGKKYLDMGGGLMIAADKNSRDAIAKNLMAAAQKELDARYSNSSAATLADPLARSREMYVRGIAPFFNNSYAAAQERVQNIVANASTEEKGWHLFNRAIKDYSGSGLSAKEKLDGLAKCLPHLGEMGFKLEQEIDPKNFDINSLRFIEQEKTGPNGELIPARTLNFSEFAKLCEENDKLGKTLDNHVSMMQWEAAQKVQRKAAGTQAKGNTKAAGSEDAMPTDETEQQKRQEVKSDAEQGRKFARANNISGSVDQIWRELRDDPKSKLKSEDEVFSAVYRSADYAMQNYQETKDYGKANQVFVDCMKSYGVPAELVPKDIWRERELADRIANGKQKLLQLRIKDGKPAKDKSGRPAVTVVGPHAAMVVPVDKINNSDQQDETVRQLNKDRTELLQRQNRRRNAGKTNKEIEEKRRRFMGF